MAVNHGYDNGQNDWTEGSEGLGEAPDDNYKMSEQAPPLKHPFPPYNKPGKIRKTGHKSPPCWSWLMIIIGLVLISVTAAFAALYLMHGGFKDSDSEAGVIGSLESTSKIPETTTVPIHHPPATASFIMECIQPAGLDGHKGIDGLCWKDGSTLIGIQHFAQQVIKFDLDIKRNTCESSVIDSGYKPVAVSCAPDGDIFVTDSTNNTVQIYDKLGGQQMWKPTYITNPEGIAVNRYYIIVSQPGGLYPVNLYNREMVFIRNSTLGGGGYRMGSIFLTEDELLLATTLQDHKLLIYNVNNGSLVETGGLGSDNGKLHGPISLWPVFSKSVFVSDKRNERTSAFSYKGRFLYNLRYDGGSGSSPSHITVIPRVGSSSLMAQVFLRSLKIYYLRWP